MKLLIGNKRNSLSPIKLLMAYVVSISLIPITISFMDFGNNEAFFEDWNVVLGWSIALCVPLVAAVFAAAWHFKKMPVVATLMILFAAWHVCFTLIDWNQDGFDTRVDVDLEPLSFAINLFVFAIPFLLVYLGWSVWLHWKHSHVIPE